MAARPEAVGTARILNRRSAARDAERRRVFDQVFTETWPVVVRHVECFTASDAEVGEIVAEVFQAAWERQRPSRTVGVAWLLRTADSILREHRRTGSIRDGALDEIHKNLVTAERSVATLGRQDVFRALSRLRGRQRRIMILTYWDGLDDLRIAEVMRIRPGVVRAARERARDRMRTSLEGGGDGDIRG